MGMQKFESDVKHVAQSQQHVYDRLADLRHLESLKERLADPAVQSQLAAELPADKLDEARRQLENVVVSPDTLSLGTPIGNITFRITEREEPKLLKLESEGSPVPVTVWIQLLPTSETTSKLRVTVGAEVNMFMKTLVAKPLKQAADGLANVLSLVR